jgi:hypothetical protein
LVRLFVIAIYVCNTAVSFWESRLDMVNDNRAVEEPKSDRHSMNRRIMVAIRKNGFTCAGLFQLVGVRK